jgi:hypothetical protein
MNVFISVHFYVYKRLIHLLLVFRYSYIILDDYLVSIKHRENGCITQELLLITFQFSNFHIHFLSHKKIIPPNKLVHFILTDWLDQDDMLTAKKALTYRRKGHSSIHQQNEQLLKKGLKPLDVKMIV